MAEKTKPSDFTNHPDESVEKRWECEMVATNIMKILKKTGDTFRELTRQEYIEERDKEGNFTKRELKYFDQVIPYCKSAKKAKLFSKAWADEVIAAETN